MDFKDITVSCYDNVYDTVGHEEPLQDFLQRTNEQERDILMEKVNRLRSETDKSKRDEIKKSLPQVCISGMFSARKSENLLQHSGLICIDIDRHDNEHLNDETFRKIGKRLEDIPNIAFVSHSVGGIGWYALIPIANPKEHEGHFKALQRIFLKYGIVIDPSYKNVAQMRCWAPPRYSEDIDGSVYYNPDAVPFRVVDKPTPIIQTKTVVYEGADMTRSKVEKIVRTCEERHIDLTSDFSDWTRVGAALKSLGNDGKSFFLRLSRISDKYNNDKELERKWAQVQSMSRIGLGSFFEIAKNKI